MTKAVKKALTDNPVKSLKVTGGGVVGKALADKPYAPPKRSSKRVRKAL